MPSRSRPNNKPWAVAEGASRACLMILVTTCVQSENFLMQVTKKETDQAIELHRGEWDISFNIDDLSHRCGNSLVCGGWCHGHRRWGRERRCQSSSHRCCGHFFRGSNFLKEYTARQELVWMKLPLPFQLRWVTAACTHIVTLTISLALSLKKRSRKSKHPRTNVQSLVQAAHPSKGQAFRFWMTTPLLPTHLSALFHTFLYPTVPNQLTSLPAVNFVRAIHSNFHTNPFGDCPFHEVSKSFVVPRT